MDSDAEDVNKLFELVLSENRQLRDSIEHERIARKKYAKKWRENNKDKQKEYTERQRIRLNNTK